MTTRTRRLPALAATLALVVAGLTISQPTAARAADCDSDSTPPTISGFAPTSVTLGVNSKLVQFSIKASDPCGIEGWSLNTPDKLLFYVYDGSPKETMYAYDNDDAGPTAVDAEAYDANFNQQKQRFIFRLLRHTRWQSFNAGPEPVSKGGRVTVKASLQRADWERDAYVRFGGSAQRATVQFKAKGGSTWTNVKQVGFVATGQVSTQVTVTGAVARDGWYRVHFAGASASSAAVSSPDYVDVR